MLNSNRFVCAARACTEMILIRFQLPINTNLGTLSKVFDRDHFVLVVCAFCRLSSVCLLAVSLFVCSVVCLFVHSRTLQPQTTTQRCYTGPKNVTEKTVVYGVATR